MNTMLSFNSLIRTLVLAASCLLLFVVSPVWSQDAPVPKDTSMREVLEAEDVANRLVEEREQSNPKSIEAGTTPLSTLLGLRESIRKADYAKAGSYLDMRYLPEDLEEFTEDNLARALALVWGQQNIVNLSSISDSPEGDLNDDLPSYRDKIGTVVISTGEIPIYLQRVPDGQGGKVWKMSNATVAQIPEMWDELGYSDLAIRVGDMLPDFKFMGMSNWQVVATVLFFIFAWPLASLISFLVMKIALLIPNGFPLGIERFFRGPMRFFIFVFVARVLVDQLGLSLTARVLMESSGVDYVAFTVLFMGILSLTRDYNIRKMERAGNAQYVALLKPMTTIIKILVATVVALFWADSAGYNMSTILAGLGVGSLAVALAAQKTLENLIGALTLYAARPVNPGDFCRFGTTVGTVEEIGLRSTVIRTLNRTQVSIPNSVFSSNDVENISARDRIRYYHNIRLQLTSAEQMRFILAEIRALFYAHPRVLQETVSVRLEKIEDATALLRIDAGVKTNDYQVYLGVAEDINLRMIEIVHNAGAVFSGPGQSMQLSETPVEDKALLTQINDTVESWRQEEKLPFPGPSPQELSDLRDSLDFPPKGSPG
ncbi:MAG: mechanosensitive ion channel domain-containing protein [Halioglobus sp.]